VGGSEGVGNLNGVAKSVAEAEAFVRNQLVALPLTNSMAMKSAAMSPTSAWPIS
jgi:hypothetical protein